MVTPPNLSEAEAMLPGLTPIYPDPADLTVGVQMPSGEVLAIDDPRLTAMLGGAASTRAQRCTAPTGL
jgi:hypothetical protein